MGGSSAPAPTASRRGRSPPPGAASFAARGAGGRPPLPESPQHRDWRNARTTSAHEIDRFGLSLRVRLKMRCSRSTNGRALSDAWFELADALRRGCRRLGSASHCLYEWPEPDEVADLDSA